MPAIVGAINVNSVGSAGVFNVGDIYTVSPKSTVKTFAGAGSFNTGDGTTVQNEYSETNTYDRDFNDENIVGNN